MISFHSRMNMRLKTKIWRKNKHQWPEEISNIIPKLGTCTVCRHHFQTNAKDFAPRFMCCDNCKTNK